MTFLCDAMCSFPPYEGIPVFDTTISYSISFLSCRTLLKLNKDLSPGWTSNIESGPSLFFSYNIFAVGLRLARTVRVRVLNRIKDTTKYDRCIKSVRRKGGSVCEVVR